ncbi:MAG: hypothetical protein R2939_15395 [Kofleriaceae bacterium]
MPGDARRPPLRGPRRRVGGVAPLLLGLLAGACGRVGFGVGDDQGAVADARDDRADAALGAFAAPVGAGVGVAQGPNQEPSLDADGLVLVYRSVDFVGPTGTDSLFAATRASRGQPWQDSPPPRSPALVGGGDGHTAPTLGPDAADVVYRHGGGAIVGAARVGAAPSWAPARTLDLGAAYAIDSLAISGDQRVVVLAGDNAQGPGLYEARRASVDEPWPPVAYLGELPASAGGPWLDHAGTRLAFHAAGPGGDLDLYWAVRDGDGWGAPERLDALCSTSHDTAPTFTADLREVVFARNTGSGGMWGQWQLLTSTR